MRNYTLCLLLFVMSQLIGMFLLAFLKQEACPKAG
jgi:hypothetical protein